MERDYYGMKGGNKPRGKGDYKGHLKAIQQLESQLPALLAQVSKWCGDEPTTSPKLPTADPRVVVGVDIAIVGAGAIAGGGGFGLGGGVKVGHI